MGAHGAAPVGGTTGHGQINEGNVAISPRNVGALKPEPKYCRVLRRLLDGPLHRFEAERYPVSDHVLNSTVSELKKRGLEIYSVLIDLPGYGGAGARVAEYRLAPESRQRARQLIGEVQ